MHLDFQPLFPLAWLPQTKVSDSTPRRSFYWLLQPMLRISRCPLTR
ncbi:hypothetical protein [Rubritalea tangerina]